MTILEALGFSGLNLVVILVGGWILKSKFGSMLKEAGITEQRLADLDKLATIHDELKEIERKQNELLETTKLGMGQKGKIADRKIEAVDSIVKVIATSITSLLRARGARILGDSSTDHVDTLQEIPAELTEVLFSKGHYFEGAMLNIITQDIYKPINAACTKILPSEGEEMQKRIDLAVDGMIKLSNYIREKYELPLVSETYIKDLTRTMTNERIDGSLKKR